MSAFEFACECGKRSCREKLDLTEREWDAAAAKGNVIAPHHRTIKDVVVEAHRTFLVVEPRKVRA